MQLGVCGIVEKYFSSMHELVVLVVNLPTNKVGAYSNRTDALPFLLERHRLPRSLLARVDKAGNPSLCIRSSRAVVYIRYRTRRSSLNRRADASNSNLLLALIQTEQAKRR